MTGKPATQTDYRMSVAEFDKMMGGASFTPQPASEKAPPRKARLAKRPKKKKKKRST